MKGLKERSWLRSDAIDSRLQADMLGTKASREASHLDPSVNTGKMGHSCLTNSMKRLHCRDECLFSM